MDLSKNIVGRSSVLGNEESDDISINRDANPLEQPLIAPSTDVTELAIVPTNGRNDERALVEAPALDLVEHGEVQGQENSLRRYDSRDISTPGSTQRNSVRRANLCAPATLVLILTSLLASIFHNHGKGQAPSPPPPNPPRPIFPNRDRPDLVIECIDKLTKSINPFSNPSHSAAVDWFLKGPGKHVPPPPTTNDCTWDADFATLFALVVIRESLNITTASWYNENKVITTSSDLCSRKFRRISCDDDGHIVSLHLSNGEHTGTLPTEFGAFQHVKRIELYKNYGIIGTIPSEIGSLSNLEYLYLHETNLSGSIPSSLGKLSKLKELFVDDTKISGEIPKDVCNLRTKDLTALHADCGGPEPLVSCDKTCCTNCYNHHRNHTNAVIDAAMAIRPSSIDGDIKADAHGKSNVGGDSLEDIVKCDQEGGTDSPDQCRATSMSTGVPCVYCLNPADEQEVCTTPTIAAFIRRMLPNAQCN